MDISNIFSSIGSTFKGMANMFTSGSALVLIIVAVVAFFFALFGFKLFKIFVGFMTGCAGLAIGFLLGSIITAIIASSGGSSDALKWIPIVCAIIVGILLAVWGYKHPFGLIKFVVGVLVYGATCINFVLKMYEKTSDPGVFAMILNYVILPTIITCIVCWLVGLFLTAAVILSTSFGGAYLGSSCLLSLLNIPAAGIIAIIVGVILGVVCMIFQIKNNNDKKTKLKDFLFAKKKKS
ncbi:MAG: hypothetical protein E7607_03575 [Ruminococcaceae bacterium]|nr:hypothetical protein [Oscillospiraceae bacterium]